MKYDGILFDLDGTLWDATEAIRVSWAMALESAPDVEAPPPGNSWRGSWG